MGPHNPRPLGKQGPALLEHELFSPRERAQTTCSQLESCCPDHIPQPPSTARETPTLGAGAAGQAQP